MKRKEEDVIYIDNAAEAAIMEEVLNSENIPHFIHSFKDLAYDGIFQVQFGWGVIESPEKYRKSIKEILFELRAQKSGD